MDKKQEIIQEIIRISNKISPKPITQSIFARESDIPVSRLRYYFGSFNKAIKASGLKPNKPSVNVSGYRSIPDEDLFSAIGDLWKRFGRRPSESLMNSSGNFSIRPYQRRWGKFSKAVDEYVKLFGIPTKSLPTEEPMQIIVSDKKRAIIVFKTI